MGMPLLSVTCVEDSKGNVKGEDEP
jgi:hypothetical protein